ncbi:MAG: LapA family protein, partial [Pseudomonadota bacterium]
VRIVRYAVLFVICAALVVLGVANMQPVTLHLLPSGIVDAAPSLPNMPLSVVILAAMLLGFIVGEVFEWVREAKHRKEVRTRGKEIQQLRAENARLKTKVSDPKEDLPRIAAQ